MQRVSLKPSYWPSLPWVGVGFLALCICATSLVLPFAFQGKYASPDETAVAVVAERLASGQSPRVEEPLAVAYPWLHPRSWVSQGTALVPVGFLGWPLFLTPFAVLGVGVLPWVAWIWFTSGLYPFYHLLRQRFSSLEASVGILVMAATPMVLLYANRALFPNPAILSAFLWSLWLLEVSKRNARYSFLAGILIGIAAIIRPVELVWMLPWWIWKGMQLPRTRKHLLPLLFAILCVSLSFFGLNRAVYGQAWKVGYWVRDNIPMNTKMIHTEYPVSVKKFLPFGLHPRAIWWNLHSFTGAFLWPLFLLMSAALATYLLPLKRLSLIWISIRSSPFLWLSIWTLVALLFLYGSGVYQDHVQPGAITVGNSFLRYLLPLAPLGGVAAAYLFEIHSRRRFFVGIASVMIFAFCIFGIYAVTVRDDEGVLSTRTELVRYASISQAALTLFPPGSILISDRSDKVFSHAFRTVSPRPTLEEIERLVRDPEVGLQVGIFARPFSQREKDDFRAVGLDVLEVGAFGRERLYRVISR